MSVNISDSSKVLTQIDEAKNKLLHLFSLLEEAQVNTIPFKHSWTPAQVMSHVIQSVNGIAGAIKMPGSPANRDVAARIPELEKTFMDFSIKMKSPDFIVPGKGPYEKQTIINDLQKSFQQFTQNSNQASLYEEVTGLPFGPITKLELLHFVLFHTKRHLHQLENICKYKRCNRIE